jgi:hypothetical protein
MFRQVYLQLGRPVSTSSNFATISFTEQSSVSSPTPYLEHQVSVLTPPSDRMAQAPNYFLLLARLRWSHFYPSPNEDKISIVMKLRTMTSR